MKRFSALSFLASASVFGGTAAAGTITGKVDHPKGTRNLVVYVEKAKGKFSPKKNAKVNQKGKQFVPRVLPILVGTTVEFHNEDDFDHNVFSPDNERYNLGTFPTKEIGTHKFKKVGVYTQLCSLHPEMEAHVIVVQNPYFARTKKGGHFTIKGIPAGKYEIKVWGKNLKEPELARTFPVEVSEGKGEASITFGEE